jgi:hypothetical protein
MGCSQQCVRVVLAWSAAHGLYSAHAAQRTAVLRNSVFYDLHQDVTPYISTNPRKCSYWLLFCFVLFYFYFGFDFVRFSFNALGHFSNNRLSKKNRENQK